MPSPVPPTRRRRRSSARRSYGSAPALIGVGVEDTASGRDAAVLGSLMARATGAELMLIGIHERPVIEVIAPAEVGWASAEKQTRAMLVKTRDAVAPDARITVHADGVVWRGLRQVVRRERRDLLAVGSSRRAEDGHVKLGTTVRDLQCHLECSLVIAPRGLRNREKLQLARIGVGFDDGSASHAAVELGAAIAQSAGAQLDVRAVADDRVPGGLTTEQTVLAGDAIVAKEATSLLERTLAAVRATGVAARVDVTPGDPTEALTAFAAEVDLLVIGSGRKAPSGTVYLGKTGSAVVDGATCPVLVVPQPEADDAPAV
jgi:nucleotide-binding universal stress UspA family protein